MLRQFQEVRGNEKYRAYGDAVQGILLNELR